MHTATARHQGHRVIPAAEFDRHVAPAFVYPFEERHHNVAKPVGPELVVPKRPSHQWGGPPAQRVDDVVETLPPRGEQVAAVGPADDDAVLLERAQPLNQQVGGDAGKAIQELGVAPWALEQLADHQQGPAVTDNVEGSGQAAVLAVGTHSGIVALDKLK